MERKILFLTPSDELLLFNNSSDKKISQPLRWYGKRKKKEPAPSHKSKCQRF